MILQSHKNWQQIFRAGRITWIFHNACQKIDQIKCDAIILKNNLKKKKFHHQHMNEECHCKYFFFFTECLFSGPTTHAKCHMRSKCAVSGPESSLNAYSHYLKQSVESVSQSVSPWCLTVQSFRLTVS